MAFALFRKRNIYLPTWRLLLLLALFLVLGGWIFLRSLYPFLAKPDPPGDATILVIDGWISDQGMAEAKRIFEQGSFTRVYCVGCDLPSGSHLAEYDNYAVLAEKTLEKLGLPQEQVIALASGPNQNHRSFHSAAALYRALENERAFAEESFFVLTQGAHARRTRIIYKKVFSSSDRRFSVGSTDPTSYDSDQWAETSQGVKSVIMETIAILYEVVWNGGRESNLPSTQEPLPDHG